MSNAGHKHQTPHDPRAARIEAVLKDVRQRRMAGEQLPDDEVLAKHTDLLPELSEQLQRLAGAEDDEATQDGEFPNSGALNIRCPNCQQPIALLAHTPLSDIHCSSCGSQFSLVGESTTTRAARTFKRLGHFDLVERLGIGGFGTVWKARDTKLDRTVAVKIPRRGKLDPQDVEKFLREARTAAQLNHPNIVTVHEVGRDDDTVYIVSDLVRGVPLSDWLSAGRPTFREAAKLVEKISAALHHAHEAAVIHRDLKPQNIMIDGQGEPHLMDFGLARRDVGEVTMTLDGHVLGTPAYMSPEQARGEAHQADRRTDIYSLGVILFELLTGELPFRGNSRMLIHQVLHDEPRQPRMLNDRIPRDLETICLKAMAKEPHRRYPSGLALADDLRRFLNREPIQARPVGKVERAWRWIRRRPAAAALMVVSGVAALALAGATVAVTYNARLEEKNSQLAFQEYFHHIARANMAWQSGDMVQLEELLLRCAPDRRDVEWNLLHRLCHTELLTLRGHSSEVNAVAYSPDGKWIATASDDHTVRLWEATGGQFVKTLAGHLDQVRSLAFHPEGQLMASASYDRTARIWDLSTGETVGTLIGHEAGLTSVCFDPEGKRLCTTGRDGTVRIWDLATRRAIHGPLRHSHFQVNLASFSPDGTQVVSAGYDRTLRSWNVATGNPLRDPIAVAASAAVFSPDGKRLATAEYDGTVSLRDSVTGIALRELKGHDDSIVDVAFSPDGQRLASSCQSGLVLIWDVTGAPSANQPPLMRRGHGGAVQCVEFSRDGSRLATAGADGTVKVWEVTLPQRGIVLEGHSDHVRGLCFSPDGTQIVTSSHDGTVRLWDVRTGVEKLLLEEHTHYVFGAAFAPDGKWIVSAGVDGWVILWDALSGAPLQKKKYDSELRGVAVSPDGKWIVTTSLDAQVRVWDWQSNRDAPGFVGHKEITWAVSFNRDGTQLATASQDRNVIVWDFATRQPIHVLEGHSAHHHNRLAFSHDGTQLVAAGGDRTIKVWDLTTNPANLIRVLKGHGMDATSVALSTSESRVTAAGWDRRVIIWDAATGQQAISLKHARELFNVAFSPQADRLAVAAGDGTVSLWDVRPWHQEASYEREALGLLKFLLGKPLSRADTVDYLHTSSNIRPAAREIALELVHRYAEEKHPEVYHQASWELVGKTYLNSIHYRFAWQQAKTACQLEPDQPKYRLALAMAEQRLGNPQAALAILGDLRRSLKAAGPPADDDFLAHLRTAEELINQEQRRGGIQPPPQ